MVRYLQAREERRPDPVVRAHRQQLLAGLAGGVVEVGCGDGRNFEHYPPTVERVLAVEPDATARQQAARRAAAVATPIEIVALERPFHSSSLVTLPSAPNVLGVAVRR